MRRRHPTVSTSPPRPPCRTLRPGAPVLVLLGIFGAPALLGGQEVTGRIMGRVLDAATAAPVAGAQVFVEDGGGVLTDLNGRYVLPRLEAGTYTVRVRMLGYADKGVTGVTVLAGRVAGLDVTLEQQAVELEGITVSAARERGSSAFLLDRRRTARSLVESVGAAEIARRPDGDAAAVAKRMTGVTVSEGKYVFVRGLGERYAQTRLNGSSLPSPEPEKEVVPLDLFPSGFLESIETQKSYTPDLPADFAAGSVKIETRDFPDHFTV
ncbi:MAG TPA: carboxypeptidase regulatory-like domain-containing protein, partial [Longimicrobiales bacterium]|nr:carboxypeptidase regulatory-like domain-containing protein [Longimicrobiales bacterium]